MCRTAEIPTYRPREEHRNLPPLSFAIMPTLVWVRRRRPESGTGPAGGGSVTSRRDEAAVPDPVGSAAAVPDSMVSAVSPAVPAVPAGPVQAALPAVADGGKRTKRKKNRAKDARSAKKRPKAASERDLPTGVYELPSGKLASEIRWGGKTRYIGIFETPEQASAAFMSVKKDRAGAKLSTLSADKADALFDAAKNKAVEAVGGIVPEKKPEKKPGKKRKGTLNRSKAGKASKKRANATYERDLPTDVWELPSGKFTAYIQWGGKGRHIGTFETLDKASAACMSAKKNLTGVKLCRTDDVKVVFDAAKKKAVDFAAAYAAQKKAVEAAGGNVNDGAKVYCHQDAVDEKRG